MIQQTLRDESGKRLREDAIAEIVRRIVAAAGPDRVMLCGAR